MDMQPTRRPDPQRGSISSIPGDDESPDDLAATTAGARCYRCLRGIQAEARSGFADLPLPCRLRVRVAYNVESGDPFRLWSPLDFDLALDDDSGVSIEFQGAEVTSHGNELQIEAQRHDFSVCVSGFDANRDLEVRYDRLREPGHAQADQ